jgi:hypothetical protein
MTPGRMGPGDIALALRHLVAMVPRKARDDEAADRVRLSIASRL